MSKNKTKKTPKLKPKKVKGRITVLKAMPYKGIMIYLRQVDGEIFEFIIPFKGEIYSSYLIIKTESGRKHTKLEVAKSAALIFASAVTTVDFLLGNTKIEKKTKGIIKAFEGSRKKAEALTN